MKKKKIIIIERTFGLTRVYLNSRVKKTIHTRREKLIFLENTNAQKVFRISIDFESIFIKLTAENSVRTRI